MLVATHWHWGIVGMAAAARQQGFFPAMLLGCWRWRVGEAVSLSQRFAGAQVLEGRDLTINLRGRGRGEGGGGGKCTA